MYPPLCHRSDLPSKYVESRNRQTVQEAIDLRSEEVRF